ncbi:MAG: cupin [Chloroflexi bacterium]|nr:cupin [Chloroflexota bacterium]
MDYTLWENLPAILPKVTEETVVSRKVFNGEGGKVTLFGFAAGEELTEHTAALPAILHFLEGEATLTLGQDVSTAVAGTWVYMPAHLPHSIEAHTAVTMLLYLLTG